MCKSNFHFVTCNLMEATICHVKVVYCSGGRVEEAVRGPFIHASNESFVVAIELDWWRFMVLENWEHVDNGGVEQSTCGDGV